MASTILTPVDYGNVTSWYFAGRAFNSQPTWDSDTGQPVGGENSYSNFLAYNELDKVSYIDLGEDWANWRIEETWTKYMANRYGGPLPYAELWWDDDIDAINDGVTETVLNFVTTGNEDQSTYVWLQDVDTSATPVTPQGRYLLLRTAATNPVETGDTAYNSSAFELAIVGTIVPEPTAMGLMACGAIALLKRRSRRR